MRSELMILTVNVIWFSKYCVGDIDCFIIKYGFINIINFDISCLAKGTYQVRLYLLLIYVFKNTAE